MESAISEKNVLAVLPTGGGKSLTFQIPAIYESEKFGGLTVIISPLRALIKDQVDGFNERFKGFVKAVALSSYLSATEKAKNIKDLKEGKADILYIAPESLRYRTVLSILQERYIARIVLDEAHILSTWGKDFRPDYRYIASFIKDKFEYLPKVSCFTATATKYVLDDIRKFFNEIGIYFDEHIALNTRENIKYSVLEVKDDDVRYSKTKEILEKRENTPAIIYITQSIKMCDEVAKELLIDFGEKYKIESFHSKVRDREKLSDDFVKDEIDIIVSTSAFGMGVDKPNVRTVIHYKPSSNIEDYLQESGRGGRDGNISNSIVLYKYDDLNFHLDRLKDSIDSFEEIKQIYEALKRLSYRNRVIASIKEIIIEANWEELAQKDFDIQEIKIGNILAELERVKLIARNTNIMKMLGNSLTTATVSEAEEQGSSKLEIEIMKYLQKGKIENLYTKVDGTKEKIDEAVENLHKNGLLDFERNINFEFKKFQDYYFEIEQLLLEHALQNSSLKLKELSNSSKMEKFSHLQKKKIIKILEAILLDWIENRVAKISRVDKSNSVWNFRADEKFRKKVLKKIEIAKHIYSEIEREQKIDIRKLQKYSLQNYSIEYFLLLLQDIGAIKLKDKVSPFNKQYQIELLNKNIEYTQENYSEEKEIYYDYRKKRVHIMNEYLQTLLDEQKKENGEKLLLDYFKLDISDFISNYFSHLKELFETFQTKDTQFGKDLSDEQRRVITSKANSIMILAGPGSGKTHTLVYKIAHTIKNDQNVKPEQFLMLTHTRTAVNEFRNRLFKMVGKVAYELDIHTFHSFVNMVTGEIGLDKENRGLENFNRNFEEYKEFLTPKTALYLDEFQDVSKPSMRLICNLVNHLNIQKIVAVGDDDQIILDFIGADVKYFDYFWEHLNRNEKKVEYELLENYRSGSKIIDFANRFGSSIRYRKKRKKLVAPKGKKEKGNLKLIKVENCEHLYSTVGKEVKKMIAENSSSTIAVLVNKNDEALTIQSFLYSHNIKSHLIQDRPRFKWKNLLEIQKFIDFINLEIEFETAFEEAKKNAFVVFHNSNNLDKLKKVISTFEEIEGEKSFKGFMVFVDEVDDSLFEENEKNHRIVITTTHKSKGREFDNVIVMEQENSTFQNKYFSDSTRRKYYVAITRAKKSLTIVSNVHNTLFLQGDFFEENEIETISPKCPEPTKIILFMGLEDINLGNGWRFEEQILSQRVFAGTKLGLYGNTLSLNGVQVAYMSKSKKEHKKEKQLFYEIAKKIEDGYVISNIEIDSQVYSFATYKQDDKVIKEGTWLQTLCKFELRKTYQKMD
jgi:ATP-dependent DNA helicase RecQ